MKLITHSGKPHADDIFAYGILSTIFKDHELIRTREEIFFSEQDDTIIFDVSMKFDGNQYFDHHQIDKELREDGSAYSSFGLIWRKFGIQYLNHIGIYSNANNVWKDIDDSLVKIVDNADNGIANPVTTHEFSFGNMIEYAVKDGSDSEFVRVSEFCQILLSNKCKYYADMYKDKHILKKSVVAGDILISNKKFTNSKKILDSTNGYSNILYIIEPQDKMWSITAVEKEKFIVKKKLFSKSAGLRDKKLEESCGIKGMKFCHTGLFFAVAETKEAAIQFAKLSAAE
jgi:uncharacterized UPF0160 family protein